MTTIAFIAGAIVGAPVGLFVGCLLASAGRDTAWEEGHAAGEHAGYQKGADAGYQHGTETGFRDGCTRRRTTT